MNTIRLFNFVLLLALATPCQARDPWDRTDYLLGAAAIGSLAIDWGQTRDIATRTHEPARIGAIGEAPPPSSPERTFHEKNRLLGENPSLDRVNAYFAAYMLGTAIAADLLPREWRRVFLVGVIVIEASAIQKNYELGLRVEF